MRIAFATHPALGHVLPLLPLALAARAAGHEITFLGGASVRGPVDALDLPFVEAGPPDLPTAFEQVPERAGLTGRRLAAVTWGRAFAGVIAPEMAAGLLALAREWRPDLLVHDDSEQGTWIAAERLGIPHVSLQATAWRGAGMRLSAKPLGELRAALGLRPDAELERWHRHGYLWTRPPSLANPDDPPPVTAVPMRPIPMDDAPASGIPASWNARPRDARDRPLVAVTLGTVVPGRIEQISGILDALEPLDVDVVATVGPALDPAALGRRRPGIEVFGYVPMSRLLAASDALVFHAGSGTMLAALAEGVPLVALPFAADQPENADRIEASGAGMQLAASDRSPEAVRAAVRAVLEDVRYAAAAARVRAEIEAMPAPETLVPRLETLAAAGPDGVLDPA